MSQTDRIYTGRTADRSRRPGYCIGCQLRITLGEPKAMDTWPAKLQLTETQYKAMLVAAAEFRDLSAESGIEVDVIDFVDWLYPPVGRLRIEEVA